MTDDDVIGCLILLSPIIAMAILGTHIYVLNSNKDHETYIQTLSRLIIVYFLAIIHFLDKVISFIPDLIDGIVLDIRGRMRNRVERMSDWDRFIDNELNKHLDKLIPPKTRRIVEPW